MTAILNDSNYCTFIDIAKFTSFIICTCIIVLSKSGALYIQMLNIVERSNYDINFKLPLYGL